MSEKLIAALAYAARGWPVFPCRPGSKEPATAHGFKDASIDVDRISAWWSRRPDCNVGIATGAPGPDVLDVDVRLEGSGWAGFNRITGAGLIEGAAMFVQTRSGGLHVFFEGTDTTCASLRGKYIDYKARGGYVIAAPSVVDGRGYRVLVERDGHGRLDWSRVRALLEPPVARRQPAHRSRTAGPDVGRLVTWLAGQREGNRNKALFWACRRAIDSGLDQHLEVLIAAAVAAGETEQAARRTAASAAKGGASS